VNGDWLTLGAIGALAVASAVRRRGSSSVELLDLGYHCSQREITGTFHGAISESILNFHDPVGGLPYVESDRLGQILRPQGMNVDFKLEEHNEAWNQAVSDWFWQRQIGMIFIAERPLSDTGAWGSGGGVRSSFGDWCYRASIDPRALIGYFIDHTVAAGDAEAFGVLYWLTSPPVLTEVDVEQVEFLDFPWKEAQLSSHEPRPTLGGPILVSREAGAVGAARIVAGHLRREDPE
jgi:hypothetical protein